MDAPRDTTARALARGVLAGAAGTAVMTAAQTAYYKANDVEPSTTPAEVSEERTGALNTAMHWLYGTGWGTLYGLAARRPTSGVAFGALVWGASLVELPAMKLSPPVWKQPPSAIAPDLGFHLVYGTAVALAHRALR
jgi:uncharacterized membrane protein YagU involved in acid resistance